ncbi:MAG: ethanolamine ammonia-lyase subunit EutC [Gammaproteobacteria bacterium]|nr:ethanolamine ammonia-lyase subunit EutC [Gammaproteobacteria bacterium]
MSAPVSKEGDAGFCWQRLRAFTAARIGLGSAGGSLPTASLLAFQLAHARARDAVHLAYDVDRMLAGITQRGWRALAVASAVRDRAEYLKRPDLGRKLSAESRVLLGDQQPAARRYTLALVIADGLSALAVHHHALPLLDRVVPRLLEWGWDIAPIVVAREGRVALGDEIAGLLPARLVVMLIGERPGLSSPDSLGVYLTYEPTLTCNDAQRNCISNIRPEGLSYDIAGHKLVYLLEEVLRRRLSGVNLKDEFDLLAAPTATAGLVE